MLDYTKTAIKQIEKDLKCLSFITGVITQLIYIAYLVYTLCTSIGIFTVNITLLILSVAYFAFYLYANQQEFRSKTKRIVRIVFKRCKQLIRIYTLGVMIYGLCLTAGNATFPSILLVILMILGLVLDILLEFLVKHVVKRSHMFIEALKADFEEATKPVRTVGNFFKRVTGKEVPEEAPSKERQFLDEQVGQVRDERKNRKLEEKYLAKRKKEETKAQKRAKRTEKKASKRTDPTEEITF